MEEECAYIQDETYKLLYKFPKRYAGQCNLIMDLLSLSSYLAAPKLKMVEGSEEIEDYRVENLHETLNSYWVFREITYLGRHKFFLLCREMIFNYFIKRWDLGYENYAMKYIKENYDELYMIAIRERDEEIIREII